MEQDCGVAADQGVGLSPSTQRNDPYQGIIAAVLGTGTSSGGNLVEPSRGADSVAEAANVEMPSSGNAAIEQANAVQVQRSGPRTRGAAKRERSQSGAEVEPTSKAPRRSTRARTPFKFFQPPPENMRRKRKPTSQKENMQKENQATKRSRKVAANQGSYEAVSQKSSQAKRERLERRRRRHGQPVFTLGGIAREKKSQAVATFKDMSVNVMSGPYNPKVTHVLVESLQRSEETMCGLAAGAWILGSEYIESSARDGDLSEEVGFEVKKSENESISDGAAKHWRTRCKNLGAKAFTGINAVFYGTTDSPTAATLERILTSGGGSVLRTTSPYTSVLDSGSVNLAVVGKGKAEGDRITKAFVTAGVQCVTEKFILDWLAHPEANLENHCLFGSRTPELVQMETDRSFV